MPDFESVKTFVRDKFTKMGLPSYPDEERTIHHRQSRPSPTARFIRYFCQTMLFFMCLAVVGGIIMGIIALHNTTAVSRPIGEGSQVRNLFARSYYGNITASGNVIPTGTAPASMNNATVVVNTATGAVPSVPSPSVTVTINGIGGVAKASTEVGMAANATQTDAISAAAMPSSSGGSNSSVFSAHATDCAPAVTVVLTVTETVGGALSAQMTSMPKAVAPLTTVIIPDLYSKAVNGSQTTLASQALNATTESAGILEATQTAAAGSNLTTTLTVYEQATVILTSTLLVDDEMSASPAIPTGQHNVDNSPCMPVNGTLNGTALETVTVQPANPASPEMTQTASSNATTPVIASEGAHSKQAKLSKGIISGCVVIGVATMLYML